MSDEPLTAPHDCATDQRCTTWARGEVEAVIKWCREAEDRCRGKGDEVQAMKYRVAGNVMRMRLTSSGCVISPFSKSGPTARRALTAEVPDPLGDES